MHIGSGDRVDSISYILLLFEKMKLPARPILFKFSGQLCFGLTYVRLYEWDHLHKNNGFFWVPSPLCRASSGGSGGKTRIKSICKGKQDPIKFEDRCWIWFLILQQPSKIKSNEEKELISKKGVSWRQTFTTVWDAECTQTWCTIQA